MVLKTQLPKLLVVTIFPEPLAEAVSSVVSIRAVVLRIKVSLPSSLQMPSSAHQSSQSVWRCSHSPSLCSELSWCPSHWQREWGAWGLPPEPEFSALGSPSFPFWLSGRWGWRWESPGNDFQQNLWLLYKGGRLRARAQGGEFYSLFSLVTFFFLYKFYLILPQQF